jgi:AraC-like DNA-binding protein
MGEHWRKAHREEPMVLTCKIDDPYAGARYGPVIRDIYLLECCESGYGSVIINGKEHPIGPGDCYALLPGDTVIHCTDSQDPRRGIWCAVDGLALGRYLRAAGITSEKPFVNKGAFPAVLKWMQQLLSLNESSGSGISLTQTACIYGILGAILQFKASPIGDDPITKALGIMETTYPEAINIGELARDVGLARAYFTTLFTEQTGLPPYQYLTRLRIRKACSLLMNNSNCPVAQIAELVGMDPRNFSRFFKREMGVSPLVYRKTKGHAAE